MMCKRLSVPRRARFYSTLRNDRPSLITPVRSSSQRKGHKGPYLRIAASVGHRHTVEGKIPPRLCADDAQSPRSVKVGHDPVPASTPWDLMSSSSPGPA